MAEKKFGEFTVQPIMSNIKVAEWQGELIRFAKLKYCQTFVFYGILSDIRKHSSW